MNLGEIYQRFLFLLGKDMYGGIGTPTNFQDVLNEIVQPDLLNAYVRKFEETREIGLDLRPFIKTLGDPGNPELVLTPWSANSDFSYGDFPEDFWYFARANRSDFVNQCDGPTRKYRSLTWVDQAEWDYITGSELYFPDLTNPAATTQNGKIMVCPALKSIRFTYIRRFKDIVFDYDILAGNTISYLPPGTTHTNSSVLPAGTPSQSVELEWPESTHNEIIRRLVQAFGRNIQSPVDMTIENTKP